jgi:mycoredoxin
MAVPVDLIVYSTSWCPDCLRAKQFLNDQHIPFVEIDIEADGPAQAYVEQVNHGHRSVPTIVFPDGQILVEPSDAELAAKLGLTVKPQTKRWWF